MAYTDNDHYFESYSNYYPLEEFELDKPNNLMVVVLAISFIIVYKFVPFDLPDAYIYIAVVACAIFYLYLNGYI